MGSTIDITGAAAAVPASGRVGARFGGVTVSRSLVPGDVVRALLAEAMAVRPDGELQETLDDDLADGRGGQPARRLVTALAGPVQDRWYSDPELSRRLAALAGRPVAPSGTRGSYSFYEGEGSFLGLHRDIDTCDLTVITVLHDDGGPADPHGGLLCYPSRCHEGLSAIRATPLDGVVVAKPPTGSSVIIAGGEVAHRVLPTSHHGARIVSVLCFRADGRPHRRAGVG